MNQMPQITTAGQAYTFSSIDPTDSIPPTFFDAYFPFLQNQKTPVLSIQTSTWFTSSQQLTYSLNSSDGTSPPQWLLFQSNTGQLSVDPRVTDASSFVNLKISASDQYQGIAMLYKSLLLNCVPTQTIEYSVLQLSLNRMFSYNLSSLIIDPDGGSITFSIPSVFNILTLATYGIVFQAGNSFLGG